MLILGFSIGIKQKHPFATKLQRGVFHIVYSNLQSKNLCINKEFRMDI